MPFYHLFTYSLLYTKYLLNTCIHIQNIYKYNTYLYIQNIYICCRPHIINPQCPFFLFSGLRTLCLVALGQADVLPCPLLHRTLQAETLQRQGWDALHSTDAASLRCCPCGSVLRSLTCAPWGGMRFGRQTLNLTKGKGILTTWFCLISLLRYPKKWYLIKTHV